MAAAVKTGPKNRSSVDVSSSRNRQQVTVRRAPKPAPAPESATSPAPAPAAAPAQPAPPKPQPSSSIVSATRIERNNYQSVILVEYVAAILLTAATPIATNPNPGQSPFMGQNGRPMVKMAALTLLYLILAMLSVGGRGPGRFAAWFGGLILIVDGMVEANNLVKDFGLLSGGLAKAATGGSSAGSSVVTNTPAQQDIINQIAPTALNLPPAISGEFPPQPAGVPIWGPGQKTHG